MFDVITGHVRGLFIPKETYVIGGYTIVFKTNPEWINEIFVFDNNKRLVSTKIEFLVFSEMKKLGLEPTRKNAAEYIIKKMPLD